MARTPATPSQFAMNMEAMPFSASGTAATGLLPPLMRAAGHILVACVALADEGYTMTPEEAKRELQHATEHLAQTSEAATNAPITALTRSTLGTFAAAVQSAHDEFDGWSAEARILNLKNLADRATYIGVVFDSELAGLTTSNAGLSL